MQHALGCDEYGKSKTPLREENDGCHGHYRNHYVSEDDSDLTELVALGFMKDHGRREIYGGSKCFTVTVEGLKAMRASSPTPPKLTRSQKRYQDYRNVADCFESFGHYLRYLKNRRLAC